MPDLQGLIRDTQFQSLPWAQRWQLLTEADPEFKAAAPDVQRQVMTDMKRQSWWKPSKKAAQTEPQTELRAAATQKYNPDGTESWAYKLKKFASQAVPFVTETAGMATGGALGGAAGALTGNPLAAYGSAVGGAGAGTVAGRLAGRGINALLGVDSTVMPSQADKDLREAAITGMVGEMTGGLLGRAAYGAARVRGPEALAPRSAGEEINIARAPVNEAERMRMEQRAQQVRAAQQRTGAQLPESSVTGNLQMAALERMRGARNPEVLRKLEQQRISAVQKAENVLDQGFMTNPRAAAEVRTRIETSNQAAEKAAAAEEQKLIKGVEAAAPAPLPTTGERTGKQVFGQSLRAQLAEAEAASRARFDSDVVGYQQPKFTQVDPAPPENPLTSYLKESTPPITFSPATDVERKLEMLIGAEKVSPELPPLGYSDLREISRAAGSAQRRLAASGQYNDARYFEGVKRNAENTIEGILSAKGPEVAQEYKNLNALYRTQQIAGFREGEVAQMLGAGKEAGGLKLGDAALAAHVENPDNATDILRAFGIKKMTEGAKPLAQVGDTELLAAGKDTAREVLKPYFDDRLSALYHAAGGGRKGAIAVQRWMANPKNMDLLKVYGLENEYKGFAGRAKALTDFTPEQFRAAQSQFVADTLKVSPDKVYTYVVKSADPKKAYFDLMRVSPDPAYREAVKALIKDGIKDQMKVTDINPFSKTPTVADRGLQNTLSLVYTAPERQKILDFYTILDAAQPVTPKGAKHVLSAGDTARSAREIAETIPMGYRGYWVKHGLLTAFSWLEKKYMSAAEKLLDDALVDPVIADKFVRMYKTGETGPIRKMVEKIYKADSVKDRIAQRLPVATAAALTNAATAPEPEEPPMNTRRKTYGGQ